MGCFPASGGRKKTVINTDIHSRLCTVSTIMSFALGHRILSAV